MTGKPIPSARLNAIPWTRFTVEAQRKLEREGPAGRARLGNLGSLQEPWMSNADDSLEADEKSSEGQSEASP